MNGVNAPAVEIQVDYTGGLRCTATHGPSGAILVTDAPLDNHGRGEAFFPTDLVATALGCCMATVMGILAERGILRRPLLLRDQAARIRHG